MEQGHGQCKLTSHGEGGEEYEMPSSHEQCMLGSGTQQKERL